MSHQTVIILDFDGRSGQVLARRVRELSVYCEVKPCTLSAAELNAGKPIGILTAGGELSAAPGLDGACAPVLNIPVSEIDECAKLLRAFLFDTCGAVGDWSIADFSRLAIDEIRERVGNGRVLLALSGGVDSSVLAALLSRAIGRQLVCIFVDHGLMRKNEGDEVMAAFSGWDVELIRVNAGVRFLSKLAGVTDPEKKRKIIGEEFIRVFEEEAKKIGSVDFLAQGTIYPDVIESGTGKGAVVKSHHNVGGLPDAVDFKDILEPLRPLFKNEVRALGETLGLPDYLVWRQPFPGPGLAVRVIGEITEEKLDILRDADKIFRDEIAGAGLGRGINQYFAILTGMRSVGVKGESRTY
ncbi:MAG: glutamine-hydrolyzing GMP synthase, partial [Oscillospiraceae bacterium]|nr:glutamine-hydrolyzing GMP synthase [Oscillospiraceae bacterium]